MSAPGRATPHRSQPGVSFPCPPRPPIPPGGTSCFPPPSGGARHRRASSSSPWLFLYLAQLSHPYTSITRGRASPPRGLGTASQSRSHSPQPPLFPVPARPAAPAPVVPAPRRTPAPPGQRPSAPAPPSALVPRGRSRGGRRCAGGGPAGAGVGGVGGDQVPHVGVDVVEGLVVVVGVVRRHMLDTGG